MKLNEEGQMSCVNMRQRLYDDCADNTQLRTLRMLRAQSWDNIGMKFLHPSSASLLRASRRRMAASNNRSLSHFLTEIQITT